MTRHALVSARHIFVDQQEVQPIAEYAVMEPFTPPSRYSDQPVAFRTQLFGLGGTSTIALIILCAALFTWRSYAVAPAPSRLSVFAVAPPAAPPEPVREVPPGPEEVEKDKPRLDDERPRIELPEIVIPSLNSMPVVVAPLTADAGPPVKQTTAPESQPAPPAPQVSTGKPTWQGLVLGALNKVKRYPREARFARQQGVPYIRFVMNREGKVLSVQIERSSGHRLLDQEALSLPKRAQPLPNPPEDVKGDTIELVVPVEFFMR